MQLARPHGRSEAEEDDAALRYDAERSSAARNLLGCKNQNSFQVEVMHNSRGIVLPRNSNDLPSTVLLEVIQRPPMQNNQQASVRMDQK